MWPLQVNPRSSVPMYQQVIEGVKAAVAHGVLHHGDRLPAVRELAMELTLNPNTVAKAYQALERDNVIEFVRGRGTFVSSQPIFPNLELGKQEIRQQMGKLLIDAHYLRLTENELLQMFQEVLEDWRNTKGGFEDGSGGGDYTTDKGI